MIRWIVSSSVLIAVIIVLRSVLKGKISLRLQYALWGIVLLRLLMPFSIGSSPLSILNAVEKAPVVQNSDTVKDFSSIELTQDGTVEGFYSDDYMPDVPSVVAENKTPEEFNKLKQTIAVRDILIPVWYCGIAVMLLVFISSNYRFSLKLRRSRTRLEETQLEAVKSPAVSGLSLSGRSVPVYVTPDIDTPCLFGLFSPAIYVTSVAAENETVLRHAIEHELTHLRHGDHIWSLLRCLCLSIHWFNPLVWCAAFLSRNDSELACDESTVKRLGEQERTEYGRTLIGMTCQKHTAILTAATTMTGSKHSIKERILLIAKKPKTAIYTLVAVILIAAVAIGCTFTGSKDKNEDSDFRPDAVKMVQALSSRLPPPPITDSESVDYLWSLYKSLELSPEADKIGDPSADPSADTEISEKINVWSISVSFIDSKTGDIKAFTIYDGGLCTLGDAYETKYSVKDGKTIYEIFYKYFQDAYEAQVSVDESAEKLGYSFQNTTFKYQGKVFDVTEQCSSATSINSCTYLDVSKCVLLECHIGPNIGAYCVFDTESQSFINTFYGCNIIFREEGNLGSAIYSHGSSIYDLSRNVIASFSLTEYEYIYALSMSSPNVLDVSIWSDYMPRTISIDLNETYLNSGLIESCQDFCASSITVYKDGFSYTSASPISCFFTSYYESPKDLDLYEFLYYFPDNELVEDYSKEYAALKKHKLWPFEEDVEVIPTPIHRYTSAAINDVLMDYAGITLDDLSGVGSEKLIYLLEYDSYYNFSSDFGPGVFYCEYGIIDGDIIRLYEKYSGDVLTLKFGGSEGYMVLSHMPGEN